MFVKLSNSNLTKLIGCFIILNLIIVCYHFKEYYSDPYFNSNFNSYKIEKFKNYQTGLNKIPQILVINSDENDRWEQTKQKLNDFQINSDKITRIVFKKEKPFVSNSKAYLTAFRYAQNKNYDYVLIMEDDFIFKLNHDQVTYVINMFLEKVPIKDWDVVFLSQRSGIITETIYPFLDKVKWTLTGGSFLVNKNYYTTMIDIATKSLQKLKETNDPDNPKYSIDEIWKPNQLQDKWFTFNPPFGQSTNTLFNPENKLIRPCPTQKNTKKNINKINHINQYQKQQETQKIYQKIEKEIDQEIDQELDLDVKQEKPNINFAMGKKEWDVWNFNQPSNRIKDHLDIPNRLDQDDIELKKALETITNKKQK